MIAVLASIFVVAQVESDLKYNMYYKGSWIGDTHSKIERVIIKGEKGFRQTVKTTITKSMGGYKPGFTETVGNFRESGEPIDLLHSVGTGTAAQELRLVWGATEIKGYRTGVGQTGAYQTEEFAIPIKDNAKVNTQPLFTFLRPGAIQKDTESELMVDPTSQKITEQQIKYLGEISVRQGDTKVPAMEYEIRQKNIMKYRLQVRLSDQVPLRIESSDGLLMVPMK